jgi:hypothetical protein
MVDGHGNPSEPAVSIKKGQSKAEIADALGQPDATEHRASGDCWNYYTSNGKALSRVAVCFSDGKVSEIRQGF